MFQGSPTNYEQLNHKITSTELMWLILDITFIDPIKIIQRHLYSSNESKLKYPLHPLSHTNSRKFNLGMVMLFPTN